MATDTSTYQALAGTIIITKYLQAASLSNVCLSQTPTALVPWLINGTTTGILDTGRRVVINAGGEPALRLVYLNGLNSQGAFISETISVLASTTGNATSVRDYLQVTEILSPSNFSYPVTVGTVTLGSSMPIMPSHYAAAFALACQINVVTGTLTCQVEITRDIPYAIPNIYTPGQSFMQPICDWSVWPTLAGITGDTVSAIDDPVTGARVTIIAGTGTVKARFTPLGLRT